MTSLERPVVPDVGIITATSVASTSAGPRPSGSASNSEATSSVGRSNNGASPGITLSGDGRGCNTLKGRFEVLDVAYGSDGTVQRFAADFVQHCTVPGRRD